MILVGTYEPVSQRHRDALETVLRDCAQHPPKIDLVESDGRHVDGEGRLKQRRIQNERVSCLQEDGGRLKGSGQPSENGDPCAGTQAAPGPHHQNCDGA